MTWGSGNEILKIGNLCSIAQEVMFILDDHYTDHVSSYPFKSKMQLGDGGSDANPKGNIIVGGNPAKVIRFRFSERIISKLMSLDFSLVSKEVADKCLKELYLDITEENVDEVVNTIKEYQGYVTPDSNISP